MKWFMVIIIMGVYNDGGQDIYLYQKPTFNTVNECTSYVKEYATDIFQHMQQEFSMKEIERVLCVREDKLDKLLQPGGPEKKMI